MLQRSGAGRCAPSAALERVPAEELGWPVLEVADVPGQPAVDVLIGAAGSTGRAAVRTATLSDDGVYRYQLARAGWADANAPSCCWVMLNPSTADAETDDPTIRRVVGFTRDFGFAEAVVVNLFALRATNPRDLRAAAAAGVDIVGPDNDAALSAAFRRASLVIAAWGTHPLAVQRAGVVAQLMRSLNIDPRCLRVSKSGHPCHPLYLPRTLRPTQFAWPEFDS